MANLIEDQKISEIIQRSKLSPTFAGCLKRLTRERKWIDRYCLLYQNFLIEFEDQCCLKATCLIPLEHYQAKRMEINNIDDIYKQNVFYLCDISQKMLMLKQNEVYRANDETSCRDWVDAINQSSYAVLKSMKEELEYRNVHLLSVIESERETKWKLEEFAQEQRNQLESLRKEIPAMISKKVDEALQQNEPSTKESDDLIKIKKIQSFFRGLICRRRWHSIVQDYIRSPHAESMRKRNCVVFQLVRSEEEYVECLSILVSAFYRPCKMAASSKNKPLSHDEVNSIFLNSETLMFLHQIFLKGLQTRMESWPKVVLGDLFDMLLPMLSIYQEYVRNHHYSLQTLSDCKQRSSFRKTLKSLENSTVAGNRTLDTFLTYPMHRIPKYIAAIQKLLALTQYDHVERVALEHSQSVLEELSSVMHDEVSETENIRKNLCIERMFTESCDFLLNTDEILIRQGVLLQLTMDYQNGKKLARKKSAETKTESVRHCFLFSQMFLVATRVSGGKLQLINKGKFMLKNATLIEDIVDEDIDFINFPRASRHASLAFKLVVSDKDESAHKLILMAASPSDKAAWTSDISQCKENLRNPSEEETVSVQSRRSLLSIRADTTLTTDAVDIKYSRALDSCRLPRIQYATVQRLLGRLLDVRFLSVEFLNTFLTTHSIFTTSSILMETIIEFYYARASCTGSGVKDSIRLDYDDHSKVRALSPSNSLLPPLSLANRRHSSPSIFTDVMETNHHKTVDKTEIMKLRTLSVGYPKHTCGDSQDAMSYPIHPTLSFSTTKSSIKSSRSSNLSSSSNFCLSPREIESPSVSPSFKHAEPLKTNNSVINTKIIKLTSPPKNRSEMKQSRYKPTKIGPVDLVETSMSGSKGLNIDLPKDEVVKEPKKSKIKRATDKQLLSPNNANYLNKIFKFEPQRFDCNNNGGSGGSHGNCSGDDEIASINARVGPLSPLRSGEFQRSPSPRSPLKTPPTPGVVVTSYRLSQKRSSITNAAIAFAAATAGATISPAASPKSGFKFRFSLKFTDTEDGNIVTKRVLKILKHWVTKQPETIQRNKELKNKLENFLLKLIQMDDTAPIERKLANSILKSLVAGEQSFKKNLLNVEILPSVEASSTFDQTSTLVIAEQMTLLDHILLKEIPSKEFLGATWMKDGKQKRAKNIMDAINQFNVTSRLVSTEILSRPTPALRASVIEKWTVVADMCRCLHNFNSVLAIITSFTSSAIFRLKKTWEKVSKQTQILIEKLKTIVSADGRFRNMREALKCCDPPSVPYLGFYLTDLASIEEQTSVIRESSLVNFAKMRMITNVIQEIRFYQSSSYMIEKNEKIMAYLMCVKHVKDEDRIYKLSLDLERKNSHAANKLKFAFHFGQ